MTPAFKFVFGAGWGMAWNAVLLLSLAPLYVVMDWLRTMQPGKGPQGGEVVFLFLFLALMIIVGVSFVNGLMWAHLQPWPWAVRYLLVPLALIVAWSLLLWLIFWLANTASLADETPQTRAACWWGLVATFAVVYLANLWTLHLVREG
jgi:hypothetical protein